MAKKDKILIILVLLIINISGQAVANYPVTITDDLDHQVRFNQPPQRIVSLAPNITEILYKLNLETKVIGVTKFCNYPPRVQKKKKVSVKNIESIITLRPDVVIAAGIVPKEVIKKLAELDIKVVAYKATSISDTLNTIRQIAKISGAPQKGSELIQQMQAKLNYFKRKVRERLAEKESRPRVFYEIWYKPLRTVGQNTFINDLITTAGGKNIADTEQGWPQYSLEKLLLKDPDVYIVTAGSGQDERTAARIKARPNYKKLAAVKNNRVHIFNGDLINRPGPRLIKGLELFIKALHPKIKLAD